MKDNEICNMYRWSKNKKEQIQILSDLTCMEPLKIIRILVKNKEKLPKSILSKLYKQLDILNRQIVEKEKQYREIVQALSGK